MVTTHFIQFANQCITLYALDTLAQKIITRLFKAQLINTGEVVSLELSVSTQDAEGQSTIAKKSGHVIKQCSTRDLPYILINEIIFRFIDTYDVGLAIHAAAVKYNNKAILLPGATGNGKSTFAAWMLIKGCQYLTDELVCFDETIQFTGFNRPLRLRNDILPQILQQASKPQLNDLLTDDTGAFIDTDNLSTQYQANTTYATPSLLLFPNYQIDADIEIRPLSQAQAGMQLMACNVNAQNLPRNGLKQVKNIVAQAPAFRLTYGSTQQLDTVLMSFLQLYLDSAMSDKDIRSIFAAIQPGEQHELNKPALRIESPKIEHKSTPEATPAQGKKRLCIGMATYDDYDGVYFSAQALRLFHPEVTAETEIIVIDNNPTGPAATALKKLDTWIAGYRYIPNQTTQGTAIRDFVFQEANADFVLCMDSHVLLQPGSLAKLLAYFSANPETNNLLQGPMLYDNLNAICTHFDPVWRQGMYGIWGNDSRANDPDAEPFAIPMQGLGLFACRKQAWLGFNPRFHGFGGEEGYIHEKFRRASRETLCLPFLRWLHRFERPLGVPYQNKWEDRIHNYYIGWRELGLDTSDMIEHFRELIGINTTDRIIRRLEETINVEKVAD